jgi:CheY-like chemotaxis protein
MFVILKGDCMKLLNELRPLWMGLMYDKKILLVESDLFIRNVLAQYLRHHGWSVTISEDLSAALDLAPDLIIMDGEKLKSWSAIHWKMPQVPVVLITDEDLPCDLSFKTFACLSRPLKSEEVFRMVHRLAVYDLDQSLSKEKGEYEGKDRSVS